MLTRRDFMLGSGALAVAVSLPLRSDAVVGSAAAPEFVTAYLEVSPDGRVLLHSPTTEMGQGTHTGHAVIIADELGVDIERVSVVTAEPADGARKFLRSNDLEEKAPGSAVGEVAAEDEIVILLHDRDEVEPQRHRGGTHS